MKVSNLFFAVVGAAIVVYFTTGRVNSTDADHTNFSEADDAVPYMLAAIGGVFTVASLAGFCGARTLSRRLLVVHLAMVRVRVRVCSVPS
jgi:hypothetical protein